MNDRHRTIQQFYRRHHHLYMLEMMERIREWTACVYHEYLASVKVEKLKGNLKDGTVERMGAEDERSNQQTGGG